MLQENDEISINAKNYPACELKMVEIYGGKDPLWEGWHNLILHLENGDSKSIAVPIDQETSAQLKLSILVPKKIRSRDKGREPVRRVNGVV